MTGAYLKPHIEYDLDLSGGLMEEIQKLIAPPMSEETVRELKRQEQELKRGWRYENLICNYCTESGDMIQCDRCLLAFHPECFEPPLELLDLPEGEFLCRTCSHLSSKALDDAASGQSNGPNSGAVSVAADGDSDSGCEWRRSGQKRRKAKLAKIAELDGVAGGDNLVARAAGALNWQDIDTDGDEARSLDVADSRSISSNDALSVDMRSAADDADSDHENPLLKLARGVAALNPQPFAIPPWWLDFAPLPGTSRPQSADNPPPASDQNGAGGAPKKAAKKNSGVINGVDAEAALDSLVTFCFQCGGSSNIQPLLLCDYCPLAFHIDCVDPPLATVPPGRWMCPNHLEPFLDAQLLSQNSLSERMRLWRQHASRPVDARHVLAAFARKCHNQCPPFMRKVRRSCGPAPIQVPAAVKALYANPCPLLPTRVQPADKAIDFQQEAIAALQMLATELRPQPIDHTESPPTITTTAAAETVAVATPSEAVPMETDSNNSNATVSQSVETGNEQTVVSASTTKPPSGIAENGAAGVDDSIVAKFVHKFAVWYRLTRLAEQHGVVVEPTPAGSGGVASPDNDAPADAVAWATLTFVSPLSAAKRVVPICNSVFTVGCAADADLDLSRWAATGVGCCRFLSPRHATIYRDKLSGVTELLNYSPFGTNVDNVLFCVSGAGAHVTPTRAAANEQQALHKDLRRLVGSGANEVAASDAAHQLGDASIECSCSLPLATLAEQLSGWEGPALLHNGSLIQFGCMQFVFSSV